MDTVVAAVIAADVTNDKEDCMQTYWDHTEKERAAMSRQDVERWLDAELMTKGVLKVEAPELDPVPEQPEVEKVTYFQADFEDSNYSSLRCSPGFLFRTANDAQAFLELHPVRLHEGYRQPNYTEPLTGGQIKSVETIAHADWLKVKNAMETSAAVHASNERKEREFNEASKKQREVLRGVWEDWEECRATAARHQQVLDTFEEYRRIANGDVGTAMQFLLKVFPEGAIQQAYEWCEAEVPASLEVCAAASQQGDV